MHKISRSILTGILIFNIGAGFTLFQGCIKTDTYEGNGKAVFYTNTNSYGQIMIVITGGNHNPTSFNLPVTNDPDKFCETGYTGLVLLDVGTYNYTATASTGKEWTGSITIQKDLCIHRLIN